jgi:hypothetical protein
MVEKHSSDPTRLTLNINSTCCFECSGASSEGDLTNRSVKN